MAGDAAQRFAELARALREAADTGLKRELNAAINDAVKPLAAEVRSVEHLKKYLPDPYAEIFAEDLTVLTSRRTGQAAGVIVRAKGKRRDRHVARREQGILWHPVYAQGPRESWRWAFQRVEPGFFGDVMERSSPQVRAGIEKALDRVTRELYRFTRG